MRENVLFSKREARLDVYEKWKIANIYESRAVANLTIDACQQKAREDVDIIAFGLSSWRQAKEQLIDEMLNKGVKIRIITMDPDCDVLSMRDVAEGKAVGTTRQSILQLPLDFYFRVDDHVFVGPYLFGKESQQLITYEFEKGGVGFKYYTDYFEKLWSGNSVPKLQLFKYEELNPIVH